MYHTSFLPSLLNLDITWSIRFPYHPWFLSYCPMSYWCPFSSENNKYILILKGIKVSVLIESVYLQCSFWNCVPILMTNITFYTIIGLHFRMSNNCHIWIYFLILINKEHPFPITFPKFKKGWQSGKSTTQKKRHIWLTNIWKVLRYFEFC